MSASPKRVNFAIVGMGRVAPTHVDALRSLGDQASLVAVCDTDTEKLYEATTKISCQGFGSLAEMVAQPEIDVVSICTPSGQHAEHGKIAAQAGKHVLVEKPLDVNAAAAQSLVECCKEHGVDLFCVFQNRYNPTIQLLKAAIEAGKFGTLYAINSTVIWERTQAYYDADPWRGTMALDGGAFMNQGIHFVDAMRYLGGEITGVTSMLGTLNRSIECEDTGSALFRFASGAMGNLFITMIGPKNHEGSLTVIGEKGFAKIGGVALNRIEEWEVEHEKNDPLIHPSDYDYETESVYGCGHLSFYQKVTAYLNGQGPKPSDGTDGLHATALIQQIYKENKSI